MDWLMSKLGRDDAGYRHYDVTMYCISVVSEKPRHDSVMMDWISHNDVTMDWISAVLEKPRHENVTMD